MKYKFIKDITLLFCAGTLLFCSCSKEGEQLAGTITTPPSATLASPVVSPPPCGNRLVINAKLVPIGSLSEARIGLVSAAAGNKILFAGGMAVGSYSSRVDIYDVTTNKWSTAELSKRERQAMAVVSVGNKILFAGGGDNDWGGTTTRVDIYDASTNTWSVAELSQGRESLAAVTLGNKVFFAGGLTWETSASGYGTWANSNVVDIYDNSTNTWSTATLSDSRSSISATVVGSKVYFAGGEYKFYLGSSVIDIYDADKNSWSTSNLQKAKGSMASIAVSNKIFYAGGVSSPGNFPGEVEIRDVNTGVSSFTCMIPRSMFNAVKQDDNIIFFTGNISNNPFSGTHFEIYNIKTDTWSTGVLNQKINDATIISVNNTIYVAGGRDKVWSPVTATAPDKFFKQVWKLEF